MSSAKIVGENDNVVRIMSIHKSKGLEFPVVFLCGIGKQFNKQDLNDNILLHQDLGFGPNYIDCKKRIEFPTLAKEAMKLNLETEMISEEMRVLYVALTRAREKLIITGTVKDFKKNFKDKEEMLLLYKKEQQGKIQERLLKKYTSYLDWLLLLILQDKKQEKLNWKVHSVKENKEEKEDKLENKKINDTKVDEKSLEKIRDKLEWEYPYLLSSTIPTKTSVSKIKEQKQEADTIELKEFVNKKQNYHFEVPKFIKEESSTAISSARKGTLVHLCLQKLDTKVNYDKQKIEEFIQELVDRELILKEEAQAIPVYSIEKYMNSNLLRELREAKEVYKEQPFYLYMRANKIDKNYPSEDKILVQGIIDLYYINKENELVLVDYKTDYVEKGQGQILIDKYKEQLNLYRQALEQALNRKVDKVLIYSTLLGEIEIS